jgi:hypothetical protein
MPLAQTFERLLRTRISTEQGALPHIPRARAQKEFNFTEIINSHMPQQSKIESSSFIKPRPFALIACTVRNPDTYNHFLSCLSSLSDQIEHHDVTSYLISNSYKSNHTEPLIQRFYYENRDLIRIVCIVHNDYNQGWIDNYYIWLNSHIPTNENFAYNLENFGGYKK